MVLPPVSLRRSDSGGDHQRSAQILPKERKNEVCQFVAGGLEDFSISRTRARAKGWGIAVPGDDSQIVYVWFDALANYLSVLGFPDPEPFTHYWQNASERWHVIGKDILRFHAVYWPAILLSARLPLPTTLCVHGFITSHGKKLGKSLGNAIDPFRLVGRYGVDAVRYYLLSHLHATKDATFAKTCCKRRTTPSSPASSATYCNACARCVCSTKRTSRATPRSIRCCATPPPTPARLSSKP
ncbi:MAG TPA: class I tRNA ligase family protein [Polyangiaceae bacterium]